MKFLVKTISENPYKISRLAQLITNPKIVIYKGKASNSSHTNAVAKALESRFQVIFAGDEAETDIVKGLDLKPSLLIIPGGCADLKLG